MGDAVIVGEAPHCVYLVFHQGDERGYDYGRAVHHEGWQLVAQGLPASGGHQHECVVARQNVLNDGLLVPLEGIEAEFLLESVGKFRFSGHR